MPLIWMPQAEYDALKAMLTVAEKVDWDAYDRARVYLLRPIEDPPSEADRLHLADERLTIDELG
jgi:hypothetical protein